MRLLVVEDDLGLSAALHVLVDVHVSRVRRKVDLPGHPPLFHTVRGAGFVLGERAR